jgi:hypothetical protein
VPELEAIERALRASWSRATSDDPDEWTPEWSTRGQCGVTAYVVRELLGGDILVAPVHGSHLEGEHHAWNRLPSGQEIDLTSEQFRAGETLGEAWVGEVYVTQDGVHRGELLLDEVRARLAAAGRAGTITGAHRQP